MRKEKGDFFIFFVERQKVALATQVSIHRITTSPHHQLFSFKPIPISLDKLNELGDGFFLRNVLFDTFFILV